MSLSLSSLLNPSPDEESRQSPPAQDDSRPPSQFVQSPEARHSSASPTLSRAARPSASHAQELVHASPAVPETAHGYGPPEQLALQRQPSGEWRPGSSGYGDQIFHLPPPPSAGSSAARKMSSPSLEQYQVASRSPEQRRASLMSPPEPTFTLPPIQGLASYASAQSRPIHHEHSYDSQPPAVAAPSHEYSSAPPPPPPPPELPETLPYGPPPTSVAAYAPPALDTSMSGMAAPDGATLLSPAAIKQEAVSTPQPSSPTDAVRRPDADQQTLKALASLKNEHGLRIHSPLRESSVPVPTTEGAVTESQSKKRPAPVKAKKGTATTTKKGPTAKRRKVEAKRDTTPSSRASRPPIGKGGSLKGTPANSSPAPSTKSYSLETREEADDDQDEEMDDEEEDDEDGDGNLYCICRKPDNGTFMIGCDGTCDDWFHGKCVGIEERDKNLMDKYMCPNCSNAGIGRTTWKRMCRRAGCRQPAKAGKTKKGVHSSKYCSDECGVLFFREMLAKTRGRDEGSAKGRAAKRKGSLASSERFSIDDDLGARGGVLAAGEVKALVDASGNVRDFKKLGDGVLSPPATPDGQDQDDKGSESTGPEAEALQQIQSQKENARRRHALLKDRLKFVNIVKLAASRTASERELKPKDYCGYDSRLEWTEDEFQAWRDSPAGQQVFEQDALPPKEQPEAGATPHDDVNMDAEPPETPSDHDVCDHPGKKKCSRHLEWAKLAVDDLRMEMGDNGDRMRALDREERHVRERAALRARAGHLSGLGSVEVHGLGITGEPSAGQTMDVDEALTPPLTAGDGGGVAHLAEGSMDVAS